MPAKKPQSYLFPGGKPQISVTINIPVRFLLYYYKCTKLTFNYYHNFNAFYKNYDGIIVNFKLIKTIDFLAALQKDTLRL